MALVDPDISELVNRAAIEREIERLIDLLDLCDGDDGLEDEPLEETGDAEPSLGACAHMMGWTSQNPCAAPPSEVDLEGDTADDEPDLAAPENLGSQERWAKGCGDSRELDQDTELNGDEEDGANPLARDWLAGDDLGKLRQSEADHG